MDDAPEYASQDMLRAMAHPLRLQIMERVGRLGTARAADVAAELDVPANSVSYHLRMLARGGVIEEAPEAARDRRDRVWRLTQRSFRTGQGEHQVNDPSASTEEYRTAALAMSAAALEAVRQGWLRYSAQPGGANSLGRLDSTTLHITPAQAAELSDEVARLIQRYNTLHRDEQGVDLPTPQPEPADPEHRVQDFRVLYTLVREVPAAQGPDADRP